MFLEHGIAVAARLGDDPSRGVLEKRHRLLEPCGSDHRIDLGKDLSPTHIQKMLDAHKLAVPDLLSLYSKKLRNVM
jgi:hypothetical protein